jgi:curved DNA-binding protein CbpA
MLQSDLINPYDLLGIKSDASLSELKKNYYNMALLCHPDKGGSSQDMYVVSSAYKYIKKQLENAYNKTASYEELEDDFEAFCKEQESELPPFSQIYEETSDWIKEFNQNFENKHQPINTEDGAEINPYENNLFGLNSGYGSLMDDSTFKETPPTTNENTKNTKTNLEVAIDYKDKEQSFNKTIFSKEIIEYKEPEPIPDTITFFPLDNTDVDDFSKLEGNLKMSDYHRTFTECDLPSNVKHNKPFAEFPRSELAIKQLIETSK